MNIKDQLAVVETMKNRARSTEELRSLIATELTLRHVQQEDQNGDPYVYACEIMEQEQAERAKRGVEIGTQGSLCDGIAWVYGRLRELEEAQKPKKPKPKKPKKKMLLLWHHGAPPGRGVFRVKCDGPNPNAGYRHWDGTRWHAWSSTHRGAGQLAANPKIRKAQIKRPVMYATREK